MRCLNRLAFSPYPSNSNLSNLSFGVSTTLNWRTWHQSPRKECTGFEQAHGMVPRACNAPKPPPWFCRFGIVSLARWRHEPKFRAWFDSHRPLQLNQQLDSGALPRHDVLYCRNLMALRSTTTEKTILAVAGAGSLRPSLYRRSVRFATKSCH